MYGLLQELIKILYKYYCKNYYTNKLIQYIKKLCVDNLNSKERDRTTLKILEKAFGEKYLSVSMFSYQSFLTVSKLGILIRRGYKRLQNNGQVITTI